MTNECTNEMIMKLKEKSLHDSQMIRVRKLLKDKGHEASLIGADDIVNAEYLKLINEGLIEDLYKNQDFFDLRYSVEQEKYSFGYRVHQSTKLRQILKDTFKQDVELLDDSQCEYLIMSFGYLPLKLTNNSEDIILIHESCLATQTLHLKGDEFKQK